MVGYDDGECADHVWRLATLVLGDGLTAEYVCVRDGCGAVLLVGPDEPLPETV